jgi:hypothetical protein
MTRAAEKGVPGALNRADDHRRLTMTLVQRELVHCPIADGGPVRRRHRRGQPCLVERFHRMPAAERIELRHRLHTRHPQHAPASRSVTRW